MEPSLLFCKVILKEHFVFSHWMKRREESASLILTIYSQSTFDPAVCQFVECRYKHCDRVCNLITVPGSNHQNQVQKSWTEVSVKKTQVVKHLLLSWHVQWQHVKLFYRLGSQTQTQVRVEVKTSCGLGLAQIVFFKPDSQILENVWSQSFRSSWLQVPPSTAIPCTVLCKWSKMSPRSILKPSFS